MPVILFKLSVCFGGLLNEGEKKSKERRQKDGGKKKKKKSLIKVQGTDSKMR